MHIDTWLLVVIVILEVLDFLALIQTGRQESETRGVMLELLTLLVSRERGDTNAASGGNVRPDLRSKV